jgi:vancomycin permeability regulator SanA
MKQLEELYREIKEKNIEIIDAHFKKLKACIVSSSGITAICMNYPKIKTKKEEKVILAHEKAHYDLGTLHNLCSPIKLIDKLEYQTDKKAYTELMPPHELKEAIENGVNSTRKLSNYFGIPDKDIIKAIKIYKKEKLLLGDKSKYKEYLKN